jgi:hypothetical protein
MPGAINDNRPLYRQRLGTMDMRLQPNRFTAVGGYRPETNAVIANQYYRPRVKTGSTDRKIESNIDHARRVIYKRPPRSAGKGG